MSLTKEERDRSQLLNRKLIDQNVCLFHLASFLLFILPRRSLFARLGSRQTGGEIAHLDLPLKRTVSVVSLSAILRLCESFSPTISRLLISPFTTASSISTHLLPSCIFTLIQCFDGLDGHVTQGERCSAAFTTRGGLRTSCSKTARFANQYLVLDHSAA